MGVLGRGAMGIVYRAEDPAIGRTVAIKTIRLGDFPDPDEREQLRERLFREAQSAGILSHPGIVTIYDIAEEGDMAYIFMEFVDGQTVEQLLGADEPLAKDTIIGMLRQTATALDYAHSKGIVHRDVKPANVMISVDGEAKIADFGVAKILSQKMTLAGTILGTPNYMSPEQIQGGAVDGRSDQFSLAVIAYEIMTGEKPYSADSLPTLLYKIVREPPTPPHRLNRTLGEEVGSVLEKAFSKDPAERYGTCTEFVSALAMAANSKPDWQPMRRGDADEVDTVVTGGSSPPPADGSPEDTDTVVAPISHGDDETVASPVLRASHRRRLELEADEKKQSLLVRGVMVLALVVAISAVGLFLFRQFSNGMGFIGWVESLFQSSPVETAQQTSPELETPAVESTPVETEPKPEASDTPPSASQTPPPPPDLGLPAANPPSQESAGSETAKPMASQPAAEASQPVTQPSEQAAPAAQTPKPETPKPAPPKETPKSKPPPSQPRDHWVQIRSDPPGARVSADEDPQLNCETPCELPLSRGRHVITLSMAGHRLTPRIIQVPDVLDLTVNLNREAGTLAVTSRPPGATITLNGEQQANKTPAMIKLPVGVYKIVLTLEGHPTFQDSVEVKDQVITNIGVDW